MKTSFMKYDVDGVISGWNRIQDTIDHNIRDIVKSNLIRRKR